MCIFEPEAHVTVRRTPLVVRRERGERNRARKRGENGVRERERAESRNKASE